MGLIKRRNVFFLFLNQNKNGKSMFLNWIEGLGYQKKRNKSTRKEKTRKK